MTIDKSLLQAGALICAAAIGLTALLTGDKQTAGIALGGFLALLNLGSSRPSQPPGGSQ